MKTYRFIGFFLILSILEMNLISCASCGRQRDKEPIKTSRNVVEEENFPNSIQTYQEEETKFQEPPANDLIGPYEVISIVDGDTYDVLIDKHSVRIRIEGIDAPEKGMPFFKKSKQYLASLIFRKYIKYIDYGLDRYGRTIAATFDDQNQDISLMMLNAGMAWHFKEKSSNTEYSEAEKSAKDERIGLWRDPRPLPPWEIRSLHRNGVSTKPYFENKIEE